MSMWLGGSAPTRQPHGFSESARTGSRRMSRPPCGARCSVPRPQPFVLLLAAAGIGAVLLGEVRDGLLVLGGLIPIVAADVATTYRSERALAELRDAVAPWPTWCAMVFEPKSRLATSCPGMCCCWRRGTWCLPTFEYSPAGASSSIAASSLASRYQSRRARLRCRGGAPGRTAFNGLCRHQHRRRPGSGTRRRDRPRNGARRYRRAACKRLNGADRRSSASSIGLSASS